jgi:alpha-tubulin suppressor-like RCC1 family protein
MTHRSLGPCRRVGIAVALLVLASACGKDEPAAAPAPTAVAEPAKPAISGRGNTNCVLTGTTPLTCWGYNAEGQLGIGTTKNSTVPVTVTGLPDGIQALSAGEGPVCVVTAAGGVKCWGKNEQGQLGDGTTKSSGTPVDVTGLSSGVTAVSAGVDHACALSDDGTVRCWGANTVGQLGDGSTKNASVPVEVKDLGKAVAVTAGFGATCAVTTDGAAKCWGSNTYGQLGDGTGEDSPVPVAVEGLGSGVQAIDANGQHACAVTEGGAARCWGSNRVGQLGDGTTDDSEVPVAVDGLDSGVTAIATGSGHSCALTEAGAVKCWGFNDAGGLGNGKTKNSTVPVAVAGLDQGVVAVTAGNAHSCALTETDVKCWGYNGYGGLGNDSTDNETRPVEVAAATLSTEGPMGPQMPGRPEASESPSPDQGDHGGH